MRRISDYLYFKACCRVFCSTAVATFFLFGCEKPYTDLETSAKHHSPHVGDKRGTDSLNTQRELFLFKNDTASFYVASLELYPLKYDDISRLYQSICRRISPYRLPTKSETLLLRCHTLPNGWWGGKRCLCVDNAVREGVKRRPSTLFGGVEVLLHLSEHAHNTLLNLFVHNVLHRKSEVTR